MEPTRVWGKAPGLWDRLESSLEKVGSFISPSWALERRRAQVIEEELSSFRNARHARTSGRPTPTEGRADYWNEVGYDRRKLVDRARQLERDSVIADSMLSRATENVVGTGYTLRAQSSSESWNEDVEKQWEEWCRREADVRGLDTFGGLMALTYRSWLRDGDVATIKLADGKLQSIESDQIANPMGNIPTRDQIDGVLLDERGKPRAFLIVKDPDPMWASVRFGQPYVEVPAKDVLFLARRQRHGQTRGLGAFTNIAWLLDQIDGNIEAVTVAARMAACVGIIVERQTRMSGLTTTTDSDGNVRRKLALEPGMIAEVGQGDKIHQVNPAQPSQNFNDFLATLGRFVGLAFGLPLEIAFLDFSRTNYSSARAALLQAHKVWEGHQSMMARWASDVYEWWLLKQIRAGKIRARRDALTHDWIKPGWKWVDPEKELNADLAAVDAGIMSLADLAEKQGKDLVRLLERRAAEIKLKEELGIPEVRSKLTRDAVDPIELAKASKPDPSAEEDGKSGKDADKGKADEGKAKGKDGSE